jgi:hypothetical protein
MSIVETLHAHKIEIRCPKCGKTHEFLGWTCCDLSIEDADKKVHEDYSKKCVPKVPSNQNV